MTADKSARSKLNKELGQAILHSMLGRYAVIVFQFLSLFILSRIFSPEMFGTLAAAQVVILLFQTMATAGFAPAIVYMSVLTPRDRDGIYSVSILAGLILSVVYALVSPLIGRLLNYNADPLLVLMLISNILFSALNLLPMASLQKDRKFLKIAQSDSISEIVSLLLCLVGYKLGLGVYALIGKMAVVPIVRYAYCYIACGTTQIGRPKPGRHLAAVGQIYDFSKYQIGFNLMNFASRNADTMLVSANFGSHAVGLYNQVYRVMRYPLQLFTFAIAPALHPVLTQHRDNPAMVFDVFYKMSVRLAVLGGVIGSVMFWCSSDVLLIMLGPQWTMAAPLLQVFAVSIGLQMVLSSTGGVFQAFGASRQMMYCGAFSSALNLSAMVCGVLLKDTIYLALFLAISFAVNFVQAFYMLNKHIFGPTANKRSVLLGLIVTTPYLNLLLLFVHMTPPPNYIAAILRLSAVSFVGLVILAAYALLFERQLYVRFRPK